MKAFAVFHTEVEKTEFREIEFAPPDNGEVLIRSICSAISPGTESMIYGGRMPPQMQGDSSIPSLTARLEYPFRYGYSLVGEIIDFGSGVDPRWFGRRVFVFHPHQDKIVAPITECLALPEDIPSDDGIFLANMESALNFVMDGNPVFGSQVMVFGLGVVGLLTCRLLKKLPLERLIGADPLDYRRQRASDSGINSVTDPSDREQWQSLLNDLFEDPETGGLDLAYELSGNLEALNQAIEATGFSGTILSGSWYGAQSKPLDLGSHFHRRRIRIVSSQVSTLDPKLTERWTKQRRIALAWQMIRDLRPASLITHRFSPEQCNQAFQIASKRLENALQVVFDYP